jgi:DNA repair protein RecO (recombination protein O)
VPLTRDDAVVLRTHPLGEADRIVTLLTRQRGRIRAVAKGVRRTSSKFGARLEPFGHVDVQLWVGRSTLEIVTQVQTKAPYGEGIHGDYGRYTVGCAVLETAEVLTPEEGEPAPEVYALTLGALSSLARGRHDAGLVLDAYLLRALDAEGYRPSLGACAVCGDPGDHPWFNPVAGGTVCAQCRPPASATPARPTLDLLEALLDSDWTVADASEPPARREAAGLVAALAQWHLDQRLRALRLVERS